MSVLERIFEVKRLEVEAAKALVPLKELKFQAADAEPPRGFLGALQRAKGLGLIAEVKKASPSKGLIRENFDPKEIALAYERAGATCLSVLTDIPHFQGSPENLLISHAATSLPCLRKDFLNDPYQLYEARAWGADAVLLIAASLTPGPLADLQDLTRSLGMDALVEVHNEEEVAMAKAAGATLVGINNRNLADFSTSLSVSERLAPAVVGWAFCVSESALEKNTRTRIAGRKREHCMVFPYLKPPCIARRLNDERNILRK